MYNKLVLPELTSEKAQRFDAALEILLECLVVKQEEVLGDEELRESVRYSEPVGD